MKLHPFLDWLLEKGSSPVDLNQRGCTPICGQQNSCLTKHNVQTDRWTCVCILYSINFGSRKYWWVWWYTTEVSPTNNFYPKLICYAKQPICQYYFCKMFFGKVNPLKFPISKILCYTVEYRHIFRHRQTDVRMHWAGL